MKAGRKPAKTDSPWSIGTGTGVFQNSWGSWLTNMDSTVSWNDIKAGAVINVPASQNTYTFTPSTTNATTGAWMYPTQVIEYPEFPGETDEQFETRKALRELSCESDGHIWKSGAVKMCEVCGGILVAEG